ncbi:MAG: DEAD/DEAH box helicase [Propionibacteriales bacterium]|nr:DEAD/DEAH box helicase [Propionibacteriales bacterium]
MAGGLDRQARRRLKAAAPVISGWVEQARRIRDRRRLADSRAEELVDRLRRDPVRVCRAGVPTWWVIPVTRDQVVGTVRALENRAATAASATDASMLHRLVEQAGLAVATVPDATSWRRLLRSRRRRAAATAHGLYLLDLHAWGTTSEVATTLARLERGPEQRAAEPTAGDLLDPRLGLVEGMGVLVGDGAAGTGGPAVIPAAAFGELPRALEDVQRAVAVAAPETERLQRAVRAMRAPEVRARLREATIAELRDVSTERLRLDLLGDAGITTVGHVLEGRRSDLTRIVGVGPRTADGLLDAARAFEEIAYDETPVRLDPDAPTAQSTEVVAALVAWDAARLDRGAGDDFQRAAELRALGARLHDDVCDLLVLPLGPWRADDLAREIAAVVRRADLVAAQLADRGEPVAVSDPWAEFLRRPADFYAALADLGVGVDKHSAGDLPAGLVDTVLAQELRTDDLAVTLRSYQAFAARFALVQRRVVIGDEMGLGKTIEALAVLAHLWSTGAQRFLVVCPAAVVTNWVREVGAKSSVPVHRVHGHDADGAFAEWLRSGGVAVTTYETLGWRDHTFAREVDRLDCVVVDEAHYIKNPETWRAEATLAQVAKADRAIFLTGTPMENRVDEFRTLLGYLRPDLVENSGELAPRAFRQRVAPAYLRRNVEDVLTELPELIETEEWLEMSAADERAYQAAVQDGNFAAMRRAALLQGADSPKVQRLVELVEEAEDNGRRVVVFSYFRDVLSSIAEHLTGERVEPVFGPLTGDVGADTRQRVIDEFSAAEEGAVLLAQISVGGVGLNIQAASVVILCEPQLKPTTEAQAIARAHRMGQLRSVQVHRLLSEDSVDERIVEILATKRRAFDDFVRGSEIAAAAPEATEYADADIARRVIEAEQKRLLYAPPKVVAPDD